MWYCIVYTFPILYNWKRLLCTQINSEDIRKEVWTEFRCIIQCQHCSISTLSAATYIAVSLSWHCETEFSLWLKWNAVIAAVFCNSGPIYWQEWKNKHTVECMITNDMVWWEAYICGLRKCQITSDHSGTNIVCGVGMFYRRQAREDKRSHKSCTERRGGREEGWGAIICRIPPINRTILSP